MCSPIGRSDCDSACGTSANWHGATTSCATESIWTSTSARRWPSRSFRSTSPAVCSLPLLCLLLCSSPMLSLSTVAISSLPIHSRLLCSTSDVVELWLLLCSLLRCCRRLRWLFADRIAACYCFRSTICLLYLDYEWIISDLINFFPSY